MDRLPARRWSPTTLRARPSLIVCAAAGGLAGLPVAASGAPPWSAPVDFTAPAAQLPSEPVVAVAPEGRAVIAWWRRDASLAPQRDVVEIILRTSPSAPFVGPVPLSRQVSNLRSQPDADATTGGMALVGWTDESHAVGLRVLPGRGAIVPITTLPEGSSVALGGLRVGIAPSGDAVAVWTRDPLPARPGAGDRTVRVATRSASTGKWSSATDLSPPGADHPALAVGADGSAIVAWERAGAIEASVKGAAGGFGAPIALSPSTPSARLPAVAVNDSGDAVVAWFQQGVVASERPAGGSFGAARAISAAGGFPAMASLRAPVVAVAADGRAVATWRRQIDGRFRVEAIVRQAGAGWGATEVLSPRSSRNAGRPSLGADAAGRAIVAWSQPVGASRSAIRARVLTRQATGFGALESVSTPSGRGTAPAVGLDGTGRAVLAWREDPVRGPGRFFRAAIRFSPG